MAHQHCHRCGEQEWVLVLYLEDYGDNKWRDVRVSLEHYNFFGKQQRTKESMVEVKLLQNQITENNENRDFYLGFDFQKLIYRVLYMDLVEDINFLFFLFVHFIGTISLAYLELE